MNDRKEYVYKFLFVLFLWEIWYVRDCDWNEFKLLLFFLFRFVLYNIENRVKFWKL